MHTWYVLEPNDQIASVGGDWDMFALENGGEDATASCVVGRSIWDFINGDDTGSIFRSILFTCRMTGEVMTLKTDCSTAHEQRMMRMKVKRQPDERIRVEHDVIVPDGSLSLR